MEVNFFFQESFFSIIQAKVVQFFTYWKQKIFFGKIKKKKLWFFFFQSLCTGVHEDSKKKFRKFFPKLSEIFFLFPICKKLNNFCLDDGKKTFLEKKIYFHKKRCFFFSNGGSDGGGTFRLHFCNLHKIWV